MKVSVDFGDEVEDFVWYVNVRVGSLVDNSTPKALNTLYTSSI